MRKLLLPLCLMVALVLSLKPTVGLAGCLESVREISSTEGLLRTKAYRCSLSDQGDPVLQVEFNRLSEAAAGNIVEGEPYKDFQALFGTFKIFHNSVYTEAKSLFDDYGIRMTENNCFNMQVASAANVNNNNPKNIGSKCETRSLWYLTFPDAEHLTTKDYPDTWRPAASNYKWPEGWHFFYSPCDELKYAKSVGDLGESLYGCTMLWRYLTQTDLDNYLTDIARAEMKIGAPMKTNEGQMGAHSTAQVGRYFLLLNHITNGNMPQDFLTLVSDPTAQCGCGPEGDGIHIRQLILHAAFIKNISTRPLTIDGVLEAYDNGERLRPYIDGQAPGAAQDFPIDPVLLAPGETAIVPLRIRFVPSESLNDAFRDLESATETFHRIRNYPEKLLRFGGSCPVKPVDRSSFGAPTVPAPRTYSFGPAITLKGVSISGARIEFDRPLSNFFEIVAGWGYGSCPFLYAYDDSHHEWVRYGKIIDKAGSRTKEVTERRGFSGLVSKFKISEEELELTFVHKARLELALADGGTISLRPRNRLRPESADHYDKIKYGAEREYDFDLPVGANPANVLKSTLAVTGYYLRYSEAAAIDDESGK